MEETSVVVIGGGPVGSMLSALLSHIYRVPHVVLERETSIPTDPRAFSLGEYGIRLLQSLGIYDRIYAEIGGGTAWLHFVSGIHNDIHHPPFLRMNAGQNGVTGHTQNIMFNQPKMEAILHQVTENESIGDIRTGCEVVDIEEVDEFVTVAYKELATGHTREIRSRYVVGTDGKTGFTRKRYLEPRGVIMEHVDRYEQMFVGLNWDITPPNPKTHPDFPLWQKGYAPKDVVDAFIPPDFKFICNPYRQAAMSRAGAPQDTPMIWRTEFNVRKDEDPEEMKKPENATKLALAYMTHPGRRYGLSEDVTFPRDCMRCRRTWYYKFESRTCNKWRVGRVLLAGDAAHIFPPFGGQGVQAGFLDASSLAWRLAVACQHQNIVKPISELSSLFDSYEMERKTAITLSLEYTLKNGRLLNETNPIKIFMRDWSLWVMSMIPSVRSKMEKVPLKPPAYEFEPGMFFLPDLDGGRTFYQVYCKKPGTNEIMFTDDVIFEPSKKNLLQLVVLVDTTEEARVAAAQLASLKTAARSAAMISEATYILHTLAEESAPGKGSNIVQIATAEEFAKSKLCANRREPQGYDPFVIKSMQANHRFVLVRPDRIVFAGCEDIEQLEVAFEGVDRLLSGDIV